MQRAPFGAGLLVALLLDGVAAAQTQLNVGEVEREIVPGERHHYVLDLVAGDYVQGAVDQGKMVVFATAFSPDGSVFRPFPGPPFAERPFAFIAETTGSYRIDLTVPTVENAARNGLSLPPKGSYRLTLSQRLSARERADGADAAPLLSPQLEELRKAVRSGNTNTDAFWDSVSMQGTPLVEPIAGDDRYQLVTFLWRGAEVQNVAVLGSFSSHEFSGRQVSPELMMRRIDDTDVWFLTVRLPRGARFTYQLSPNDSMGVTASEAAVRAANVQIDRFNPRRTVSRPGATKFEGASIAELPGADPQPWTARRPDAPSGTVTAHLVPTTQLKGERQIWVYTPPEYDSNRRDHNLVVFFDGELYTNLNQIPAPTILDNLLSARRIRPTVAVFISSTRDRARELLGDEQFAAFVASELVPWVRSRYAVSSQSARTVVGGISAGGVAAAYVAFRFPQVFGKVLSQSGAFDWSPEHPQYGPTSDATSEPNLIAKMYRDSPKLPLEFYLDAGTFEVDLIGSGGFILEPTRHLRDVLLAKGYPVHFRQLLGGHETLSSRGTLGDALIALIGQ